MSLIKKPSELEVKKNQAVLVYGQPGIGKSTLACSAPEPVMLDFDGGVNRINGAHQVPTVQVHNWMEVYPAIKEIKEAGCFESIIVDTCGKMMAMLEVHIKETQPKMKQYDGSLSLKGYGVRKNMFNTFIKDVLAMNINLIFVAHEIEQKKGDETVLRPEIGGSSTNDLMKELDLVGYMQAYGANRTICFDPEERFYAKNTSNLHGVINIPVVVDAKGVAKGDNNFMSGVLSNVVDRMLSAQELTKKYDELLTNYAVVLNDTMTLVEINEAFASLQTIDHVYNSKMATWKMLVNKAELLGFEFDKKSKEFKEVSDD